MRLSFEDFARFLCATVLFLRVDSEAVFFHVSVFYHALLTTFAINLNVMVVQCNSTVMSSRPSAHSFTAVAS